MINKKFKSYLEHKLTYPKQNGNQTLLKLRALQKSTQKSKQKSKERGRQKRTNSNHSKNQSQSYVQTTQSTSHNYTNYKTDFKKSGSSKIKDLKLKVQTLMTENNPQREKQFTKRSEEYNQNKSRSLKKQQGFFTPNMSYLKNQKLRSTFYDTFQHYDSLKSQQPQQNYRSILLIKMEACKVLKKLGISPEQINYFDGLENIQQIFQNIQKAITNLFEKKLRQNDQIAKQCYQHKLYFCSQQVKLLQEQQKNLQKIILQLQKEKTALKEKNYNTSKKLEEQQTQIFQLKLLNDQQENKLTRINLENRRQFEKQLCRVRLEYQVQIYKQLNNLSQKQYLYTKLKQVISDQKYKNKQLEESQAKLIGEIERWEKQYKALVNNYRKEKEYKKGIQQQRNTQIKTFEQHKKVIKQGYIGLVQKLSIQIGQLRQSLILQGEHIDSLEDKVKTYDNKMKKMQEDYLALNNDFTKEVKDWVNKEEQYQMAINQLKSNLQQARQTIYQYSKMFVNQPGSDC